MEVDNELLATQIQDKMYAEMAEKRQTLGLRYFAEEIGIGHATLARVLKGGDRVIELTTFLSLVNWLGKSTDDFIIMEY